MSAPRRTQRVEADGVDGVSEGSLAKINSVVLRLLGSDSMKW